MLCVCGHEEKDHYDTLENTCCLHKDDGNYCVCEKFQASFGLEELARYLLNNFGDIVRVDDMPNELSPYYAVVVMERMKKEAENLTS